MIQTIVQPEGSNRAEVRQRAGCGQRHATCFCPARHPRTCGWPRESSMRTILSIRKALLITATGAMALAPAIAQADPLSHVSPSNPGLHSGTGATTVAVSEHNGDPIGVVVAPSTAGLNTSRQQTVGWLSRFLGVQRHRPVNGVAVDEGTGERRYTISGWAVRLGTATWGTRNVRVVAADGSSIVQRDALRRGARGKFAGTTTATIEGTAFLPEDTEHAIPLGHATLRVNRAVTGRLDGSKSHAEAKESGAGLIAGHGVAVVRDPRRTTGSEVAAWELLGSAQQAGRR